MESLQIPRTGHLNAQEMGHFIVPKKVHAALDAAVARAYGWGADISEEKALEKLLEKNHQQHDTASRSASKERTSSETSDLS